MSCGPIYLILIGLMVSGFGSGILWFGYQIHPVYAIVPGALICIAAALWITNEPA